MLDVCLIGCGGTFPLPNRHLTSLMARYNGHCILVDCGEGTQIGIREAQLTFKNIDVICIYSYKELTSDVNERKEVCNELKKYGVEVYCIEKMLWQERAKKARMIKALMNKTSN